VPGGYGLRFDDNQVDPTDSSTVIPWVMWQDSTAGVLEYDGGQESLYLQDAWRLQANLTLKIGVRYDQVAFDDNDGNTIVDNMGKLQPRSVLPGTTGDGTNVVRASWAVYAPECTQHALRQDRDRTDRRLAVLGLIESTQRSASRSPPTTTASGVSTRTAGTRGWLLLPQNIFGQSPTWSTPTWTRPTPTSGTSRTSGPLNRTSVEITYIDKDTVDIFETPATETWTGSTPTPSATTT
jgi:hypothetical protein